MWKLLSKAEDDLKILMTRVVLDIWLILYLANTGYQDPANDNESDSGNLSPRYRAS